MNIKKAHALQRKGLERNDNPMYIITNFIRLINIYFFDQEETTADMIGYYIYLLVLVVFFIVTIILNITF